jgi:hypothetical protein
MRPHQQAVYPPLTRVFKHSLDWRFLLALSDSAKGCFLFLEDVDLSAALEQAGIPVSQQFSISDLKAHENKRFPFLAIPLGLPGRWVGPRLEDRIQFFRWLRQFIDPGGFLLLGFNNSMYWRASHKTNYHSSTPPRIAKELHQAGYQSLKVFGAMPDLQISEYIFDLEPRTIQFALQNRFRRKPNLLRILGVVARIVGIQRFSYFLPGYFAVASA